MLLQPTSPLRTADDIDAAVQLALSSGCDSVISVREAAQHPFKMFCLDKDESMELLTITNPNFQKVQCSAAATLLSGSRSSHVGTTECIECVLLSIMTAASIVPLISPSICKSARSRNIAAGRL